MTDQEFEELKVGGMEVNYLIVCPRKLWLYTHDLRMEKLSDKVSLGAFIHESSYPKLTRRELLIDNLIKVDLLESGKITEVKSSRKLERASKMQILYYLYYLKQKGIQGLSGEIRFPKERRKIEVQLDEESEREIERILHEVHRVKSLPTPPEAEWSPICRPCAYAELCWG
ncbi:TPA: CRISPR-associated protein Cas4 [Candidatus Poribacteria bacterium]|nr:CRISPR-associated protein Cas4 [Candidatus Poribacteria bacterium]HEX28714.1 CRISPR-associated protein Cas4 [Candidatus Poribacteria bacterium]